MNRICAKLAATFVLAFAAMPALAQAPVTISQWGTPVTIVGGNKPNGPVMLDQNGQVPTVNLRTALSGYVTQVSLNSTLASYATQTWSTDNFIQIAVTGSEPAARGEHHFTYSGTFSDPASGVPLDAKFGGSGIGATDVYDAEGAGTGNAYACFSAAGKLYRSSTACQ